MCGKIGLLRTTFRGFLRAEGLDISLPPFGKDGVNTQSRGGWHTPRDLGNSNSAPRLDNARERHGFGYLLWVRRKIGDGFEQRDQLIGLHIHSLHVSSTSQHL